jgi:putative DNA primase/helicase
MSAEDDREAAEILREHPDVLGDGIDHILAACGLDIVTKNATPGELEQRMRELQTHALTAELDSIGRETLRIAAKERLKAAKIDGGARLVDAALGTGIDKGDDARGAQGRSLMFAEPEPWPHPVDGASHLDSIRNTMRRYVVLPAHAAAALALWVLHTHTIEAAWLSPILVLTSPQKRCGKTTVLELLGWMVRRPLAASNITASALFRAVAAYEPTLLVDEADTFLAAHDELRGILNGGHTRTSAQILRNVGDDHEPRVFCTFGCKAIAAIGSLPGTMEDRAIIIRMQRRTAAEHVERIRRDRMEGDLLPIRRQAVRWAADHVDVLRDADPSVPSSLHDRAADNWRPLLAIADLAGGQWPELARKAARALNGSVDDLDAEMGDMLLADLSELFRVMIGSCVSGE